MTSDFGYDELPELYAFGLRLRRSGADDYAIAQRLGIQSRLKADLGDLP